MVPGSRSSLNAGIRLADRGYNLNGFLIDPNGQPLDTQSSIRLDASGNFLGLGRTMQFSRRYSAARHVDPGAERGRPGQRAHPSEPYTGSISSAAPSVDGHGIPTPRPGRCPLAIRRRPRSR